MGSVSRGNRNDRFIEAFNDLFIKKFGSDDKVVTACGLDMNDSDECVHFFYDVKFRGLSKMTLMVPERVYDPEELAEYQSESIARQLGISEARVLKLMKEADLED